MKMRVVITGGSRGIGEMIANHLKSGNEVFIISKNPESINETKKKLGIQGFAADVSTYKDIENIFRKINRFDVLINCAGVLGPVGFLKENPMDEWEEAIRVNLIGTVNCCKAAIVFLSGRGKIINVAGGGSAFPRIYHTAYASSKAAIVRFTEILAKELEDKKMDIKVNVIAPGAYKTDLWKNETYEKDATWADPNDLFSMIDFLLENETLNGRFIHIRDDKRLLNSVLDENMFTLRRIDNRKFEVK